jgi:tryptophan-rich sensory protein
MSDAIRRRWRPFAAGGAFALVIASLGGALTELTPWYFELRRPAWQPPDWLFAPAWSAIFALTAFSFGLAWEAARGRGARLRIAWLFAFNMLLNVSWSWLFFAQQRPDWALGEVALLWASIAALIYVLRPVSRRAALALVPYLVWVSFAALLNAEIVRLNAPFGAG